MIAPQYVPREPDCLQATGLAESTLEALILKLLYFRGDLYGQELSAAIGLRFSVVEGNVEALKLAHHLQIRKSLGMGTIGSTLALKLMHRPALAAQSVDPTILHAHRQRWQDDMPLP